MEDGSQATFPTGTQSSSPARRPVRLAVALGLSLLSGLLYYAAFPGIGWWPLAPLAFAPLLVAIRGRSPKLATAFGLLSGTITTSLGFAWLIETLRTYSGFSVVTCLVLYLLLSIFQAGRFALFALVCSVLDRNRWPFLAAVSAAFVTSELTYPLLFPWFFGAALHEVPLLIQMADVGGPVLVGLPLAVMGGGIAHLLTSRMPLQQQKVTLLTMAIAVGAPVLYAALLTPLVDRDTSRAPTVRIGLVQGNIPMLPASTDLLVERFRAQIAQTKSLRNDVDLVVWPESAFVPLLSAQEPGSDIRRTEAGALGVPLLTGALLEAPSTPPKVFNSALILDRDAQVRGRYDKQYRLPFGEYLPLGERFPILYRLSPGSARIAAGERTAPLPFEDKRITTLICYEDILPRYVGRLVSRHRPHLIVNLTNDGWFGRSAEPEIHLALAKFRAVEHRRFLVRVTNTGRTAVVDPVGRVVQQAPLFEATTLTSRVRWLHGWTLYGLWGDAPWFAVVAATALGALWRRPSRREKLAPKPTSNHTNSSSA